MALAFVVGSQRAAGNSEGYNDGGQNGPPL